MEHIINLSMQIIVNKSRHVDYICSERTQRVDMWLDVEDAYLAHWVVVFLQQFHEVLSEEAGPSRHQHHLGHPVAMVTDSLHRPVRCRRSSAGGERSVNASARYVCRSMQNVTVLSSRRRWVAMRSLHQGLEAAEVIKQDTAGQQRLLNSTRL